MLVPSQGSQAGNFPWRRKIIWVRLIFRHDLNNCVCRHLLYQALCCKVFISTDDEQCPQHPPSIFPPKWGGPQQCRGHCPVWDGVDGVALLNGDAASWVLLPGSLHRCWVKLPWGQGPLLQSLGEHRGEKQCCLRPFYQFWVAFPSPQATSLLSYELFPSLCLMGWGTGLGQGFLQLPVPSSPAEWVLWARASAFPTLIAECR